MVQVEEAREFKLHPPLAIFMASLLGGPLAGGVLMAQNRRWAGGGALMAFGIFLLSLLGMAGYIALLLWAPTSALRGAVVVGQAVLLYIIGSILIGWTLSRAGMDDLPPSPSFVLVTLFSIVCLGLVIGAYMGGDRAMGGLRGDSGVRRMAINTHADILYWGQSEQPAAQSVCTAIQDQAFFSASTNFLVTLGHDSTGHHIISVVAPTDSWSDQQESQDKLQKLGEALHGALPGGVTLRALDSGFVEHQRVEVR